MALPRSLTALAPGTYVATLTASTPDGRTADAGKLKFWVLEASGR
jgi:hypothetical protein